MSRELYFELLKNFIRQLIPQYRELLDEVEREGGRFQFNHDVISFIDRLKVDNYPELYRDEEQLSKMMMLGVMPADEINSAFAEIRSLSGEDKVKAQANLINEFAQIGIALGQQLPATDQEKQAAAEAFKSLSPEEQQQALVQSQVFMSGILPTFFQVVSVMVHGRKLTDLVRAAETGDDDAFVLAVQIDKRILTLPYFVKRRQRAELEQDSEFLKRLNYRLNNPMFRGTVEHKTLWLTLAVLDMCQFLDGSFKHRELLDFCQSVGAVGVDNDIQDESSFGKVLRRYRRFQQNNRKSRH